MTAALMLVLALWSPVQASAGPTPTRDPAKCGRVVLARAAQRPGGFLLPSQRSCPVLAFPSPPYEVKPGVGGRELWKGNTLLVTFPDAVTPAPKPEPKPETATAKKKSRFDGSGMLVKEVP